MVNWKQIVEYRKHRLLKTTYIMLRFTLNKRVLIIVALSAIILSCLSASSQQVVTLKMCHESADSLYPIVFQKQKLTQINELALQNLQAKYLPEIGLSAKATYQSKVTEMPLAMPGVSPPVVPHEQFSATIDISQIIYDGGTIKAAKQVSEMQTQNNTQQVNVNMYKLKEQINNIYFLVLALQENEKILELIKETINERKTVLKAAVDNGILNISELDNLNAELLKIDQQKIELSIQIEQATFALKELSCINNIDAMKLDLPNIATSANYDIRRPENELFTTNISLLSANAEIIKSERMPKVVAFGSGGVGYPGLNMFSETMEPYLIVGAQVKWTIADWKQTSRQQEQLSIQKASIYDSENAFNKQLQIEINEAILKQTQLEQLIEKDKQIIELRNRISKNSAAQLENGTITSADYIHNLNEEKQASINMETHKIQLEQAKLNRIYLSGKPIFE